MKNSKTLLGLVAAGVAVALAAPGGAIGATRTTRKTTTTRPAATTTRPATTAPAPTAAPTTTAAAKTGGKLVFGLEAETGTGWLPGPGSWAISGTQVSLAVYERLFYVDGEGELQPWLGDSASVSQDGLTWTIKVKGSQGIKFHNGEAFNAAAVKSIIEYNVCGSTLAPAWFRLNGFGRLCSGNPAKLQDGLVNAVDENTVAIRVQQKFPSLPQLLAGQTGAMAAPAQLKANDRNTLIGTGPFKFKSWKLNDSLVVVRNDDYWNKAKTAKLDEITFVPIPDENARLAQLSTGQLDMSHTANYEIGAQLADLAKKGTIKLFTAEELGETNHDILNTSIPPFNNQNCRLAAAHALDIDTLIRLKAPGATKANGIFLPGQPGYVGDTGYPEFNLDKARAAYEKCKAANGGRDVEFTMATTNSPETIAIRDIQKQMVERAGFGVKTANIEQAAYVTTAIIGNYQWQTWRYYAYLTDIDAFRWNLHSETALPNGRASLNWSRISDGQIDAALDQARDSSDPALRKRVMEAVNRQLGEQAYMIMKWRTRWHIPACKTCTGFDKPTAANGKPLVPFGNGYVDLALISKG